MRAVLMRMRLAGLLFALVLFPPPDGVAADAFFEGISAYNRGAYREALAHWRPLAVKGDPKAQSSLGFLYYKGLGVPQDSSLAAAWFYRAAVHGRVEAQTFLGVMHFLGDGVPRNFVLAHMWCDLAVGGGYSQALDCREAASSELTPAQLAEARRLVVDFRKRQSAE